MDRPFRWPPTLAAHAGRPRWPPTLAAHAGNVAGKRDGEIVESEGGIRSDDHHPSQRNGQGDAGI